MRTAPPEATPKPEPLAVGIRALHARTRWALALLVLALALAIVNTGLGSYVVHEIEELEHAAPLCCNATSACNESAPAPECWDYDPCTLDVALPGSCAPGAPAVTRCEHRALADGTPCDAEDFCYYPGDARTCQQGVCLGVDEELCKGFCQVDADCIPIELEVSFFEQDTFCYAGSCVTSGYLEYMPIADPEALIHRTLPWYQDVAWYNLTSCVTGACAYHDYQNPDEADMEYTICLFTWDCAFFDNPPAPRRRAEALNASLPRVRVPMPGITDPELYRGLMARAGQFVVEVRTAAAAVG